MAEGKISAVIAPLFLAFILGAAVSCKDPEPYRIGFIGALTGNNAVLGIDGRNGFLLAVEEQNDRGGVGGRPLVAIIKNGEMNPDIAVHQLEQLAAENVEAVIGPFTSSQAAALLPQANKAGILIISPTASSQDLTGLDDMLFKATSPSREVSHKYADYMTGKAGLMTAGIIFDRVNRAFSVSWMNEFTARYESAGGKVVFSKGIDARLNTDFTAVLDSFIQSGAECLLLVANSIDSSNLIQHFRLKDRDTPVFVSGWAGTAQLIELGGKSVDGTILFQSYNPYDESSEFRSFVDAYRKRFKSTPAFASVLSYESTEFLIRALEDKSAQESLKDAMLRLSPFDGLQEKVLFDAYGDAHRGAVMSIIENGTIRKIE